jgi:hypothetical protein
MPSGGTIHIEEIQDQVELALMRAGEQKVARDYVIYRDGRSKQRAAHAPAIADHAFAMLLTHTRALATSVGAWLSHRTAAIAGPDRDPLAAWSGRARLVFGFDATASREPAWATARQVTDALVRALPGELDVALAVHGGSRLHTFTDFTTDPNLLRDQAASISCRPGHTQLLPLLSRPLRRAGRSGHHLHRRRLRGVPARGRKLADELGERFIRLIVLHDTTDWTARRDAELFLDLARRTCGFVLPFDANAPSRLRELLAAIAVFAVGGTELLQHKRDELPGAVVLLRYLNDRD